MGFLEIENREDIGDEIEQHKGHDEDARAPTKPSFRLPSHGE